MPVAAVPESSSSSLALTKAWNGFKWAEYQGSSIGDEKGIEFAERKANTTSASSLFNWEMGVKGLALGVPEG